MLFNLIALSINISESDLLHQLQSAIGDKASDGSLYFSEIDNCIDNIHYRFFYCF